MMIIMDIIDFSDITVNVDIFDVDLFSQAVNSRKLNSC